MIERLAEALSSYTARQTGASPFATPVDGMLVLRSDHPKPAAYRVFRPCLCVVAQGAKWASFGGPRLTYGAGEALVVGMEAPSVGRVVEASPEKPCLVLVLELDPAVMRAVAQDLDGQIGGDGTADRAIFVTGFEGPLLDCALRLVRLLETPQAIPALQPLVMREICYWLLSGPCGASIARLALGDGPSRRVMRAVHDLRARFTEAVRVEELAAVARLSPSAFHRQFKSVTSYTPLQYQKHLRLLEARRLMVSQGLNVERAAFAVGYESPSQFSREYNRLFGAPPKRHMRRGGAPDGASMPRAKAIEPVPAQRGIL